MNGLPKSLPVLQPVQQAALDFFSKYFPLTGKVLEVGSDMNCVVAVHMSQMGAIVTAHNSAKGFAPPAFVTALKDDLRDLRSVPDGYFDAVISINGFMRIHTLHVVLAEIARVLKPGGYFGTLFGPIWSSAKGHHLWAKVGEDVVSFWNPQHRNPLDDYAHLLLTPNEMRADLQGKGEQPAMIEAIIQAVYLRDDATRWMHGHYVTAFRDMPLELILLEPHNRLTVSPGLNRRLTARWGAHDFGVTSLRVIAQKP